MKSQELVLTQVHPLNNVPTIVEHSFDIFRIDGACEVRVTVVLTVAARRAYTLKRKTSGYSAKMSGNIQRRTISIDQLIRWNERNEIILTRNSSLIKYFALMTSGGSEGSATTPGSTGVW